MLNTGLGFSDEFELETLRHSEKLGRRGKHYKDFLKNVKDKVCVSIILGNYYIILT